MEKTMKPVASTFKKILVPTDFSENAMNATYYAAELAGKINATLILLNVFHLPVTPVSTVDVPVAMDPRILDAIQKTSEERLSIICDAIKEKYKVACEYESRCDFVIDGVKAICSERKIDLIVMGTQGAGAAEGLLVGTNTAQVIEQAECPVIAVPEHCIFTGLKRITYATDLINDDIRSIAQLVPLASVFNASIDVLHIYTTAQPEVLEKGLLDRFIGKVKKQTGFENIHPVILENKNVRKALDAFVENNMTNMLVLSTRKRSFIDRLFERSTTKKLVYHMKLPLMAFHHVSENERVYVF